MFAVCAQVTLLKAEAACGRNDQDLGFVCTCFCAKLGRVLARVRRRGLGAHPGGRSGVKSGMKKAKRIRKYGIMSRFTAFRNRRRSVVVPPEPGEEDATKTIQSLVQVKANVINIH